MSNTVQMATIIVAYDRNRGIGIGNRLPWHLSGDLRWVAKVTTAVQDPGKRNAIVMGRKTWESLPPDRRPLKNRVNMVVSRSQQGAGTGAQFFDSLARAVALAESDDRIESVFIFGGETIYREALEMSIVERVIATEIDAVFPADAFFPVLPPAFELQQTEVVPDAQYRVQRAIYVRSEAAAAPTGGGGGHGRGLPRT